MIGTDGTAKICVYNKQKTEPLIVPVFTSKSLSFLLCGYGCV